MEVLEVTKAEDGLILDTCAERRLPLVAGFYEVEGERGAGRSLRHKERASPV